MNDRDALLRSIEKEARATAHYTGRGQFSRAVMDAIRAVDRRAFVPDGGEARAYVNAPLPIGHGQTISQPFIVALMTDLLDLHRGDNVLEVGTGSGYQAAVLARLTDRVCSIEIIPALAECAAKVLADTQVELRTGDGALGWPERAPFDAIIVTAAAPHIPQALLAQLAPGGRMVVPVGEPFGAQELHLLHKRPDGGIDDRSVLAVAFVPLTRGSTN